MVNLHEVSALQRIDVNETTYIRPLQDEDAGAMLAILEADTSIREQVAAAARMRDKTGVENEVKFYQTSPDLIRYSIVHNQEVVGLVSFWSDGGYFDTEPIKDGYGFGYFLSPSVRGKGIITNTIQKLMNVACTELPVRAFIAFCEDDNNASIAVLKRLGFNPTDETFIEPQHGWTERRYILKVSA